MSDIPTSAWVFSIVIIALVTWVTLWVTKKAYSKNGMNLIRTRYSNCCYLQQLFYFSGS